MALSGYCKESLGQPLLDILILFYLGQSHLFFFLVFFLVFFWDLLLGQSLF